MSFDAIRAAYPDLAIAAYALEPGGAVTLEVLTPDGRSFMFTRPTLAEAMAVAFPELTPEPPAPAGSIFD